MNMLKFFRSSGQPSSPKRQPTAKQPPERQPEIFAFRKTIQHGFPHKPTALAYDPKDKLMAIGTHTGAIKVFGRPGVEFYGQHSSATNNASDYIVQLLEFVSGSGRLLSLTTSNHLILWEPAGAMLVPIKQISFDGKLKKVSSICCSYMKDLVWIGTEGGNVYQFDLKNFAIKEPVIYHDVVLEQVPTSYKLNPGAIESVKQIPNNYNHLLIAYNRGLCVIWDLESSKVIKSFISPGHGQSVGLYISPDAEYFTWYHADGSFATWKLDNDAESITESCIPYGPDPCKSINSLVKAKRNDSKDLIIFSGGMPRSAYGDRQSVSVHCSDGTKVCLDFTSKVIDFFVTFNEENEDEANILIVLLEEELCAFDLNDSSLSPVRLPYLHSIHVSAVTCNHLQSQVTSQIYEKILEAGQSQLSEYSDVEWPITGGSLTPAAVATSENGDHNDTTNDDDDTDDADDGDDNSNKTITPKEYEILMTGHEDGSVKFWDCTGVILTPLLHFKTAPLFGNNDLNANSELHESQDQLDESEPPFRKAGFFDPYSDDPRLAVKKIALCPKTGQIIIAGTAGHIVVASLEHRIGEGPLRVTTMNVVSDRDGFIWKGHDQLSVKSQLLDEELPPVTDGVQVQGVLQVLPPAAINCLALQSSWNLIAAGTSHGLVIFDYFNHHPVTHVCTLNPKDITGAGEALSRRKSFKKTLRESFRRLRRGRSTRNVPGAPPIAPTIETRPVERQIEARSTEDAQTSMVRCLTFAQTHMIKNLPHKTFPSLWFGTYAYVCAYILHIPSKQSGSGGDSVKPITADKGKEITFKQHKAPIVGITIFDVHTGLPLEFAPDENTFMRTPHRVVIATEEQFKIFGLPELSVKDKYKITAKEGVRVRRMNFARFSCDIPQTQMPRITPQKSNTAGNNDALSAQGMAKHHEVGMLCLTNAGDCMIFSVPEIKKKLNAAAVRREDINGISSLCFTNYGEALYMMSSSELQRISLAANKVVSLTGHIDLLPLNEEDDLIARHDDDDEDDDDDDDDNVAKSIASSSVANDIEQQLKQQQQSDLNATTITISSIGTAIPAATTGASFKTMGKTNVLNGHDHSPGGGNDAANTTTTSSVGDLTLDSIKDHLNSSTITTLHKQTTEEVVGRLSVLSTQTNQTLTTLKMSDLGTDINLPNFKDLSPIGDTTETSASTVVIKSVITSVTTNGTTQQLNGETVTTENEEILTTTSNKKHDQQQSTTASTTTTRKESQF